MGGRGLDLILGSIVINFIKDVSSLCASEAKILGLGAVRLWVKHGSSTDGFSSWVLTPFSALVFSSTKWGESCSSQRVTLRVKEKDYKAFSTCQARGEDTINVRYPHTIPVAKYHTKSTCPPRTSQNSGEVNGDHGWKSTGKSFRCCMDEIDISTR